MSVVSFHPHGLFQISVDNNLILIEIEGPCNTEFFQDIAVKLASAREQVDLDNYTALIVLHGEAIATQDAIQYFSQYLKNISVRAVAFNLQHASTASITEQICHKAYKEAGIKHQFFDDNDTASRWLRACMQAE